MYNYEHKKLIKEITSLDEVPADSKLFSEWIEAGMKIKDVLIDHIYKEDMKYAGFYRARLGRKQF